MKPKDMDPDRWDSVIQLVTGILAAGLMLWLLWRGQIDAGLIELAIAALGFGEARVRHERKRKRKQ